MGGQKISIQKIIESEQQMILNAEKRYGKYFINAHAFIILTHEFLESADINQVGFIIFLGHIRKHLTLALLSAIRLHSVEAMMNLRQVLEGGVCAAYLLAHSELPEDIETYMSESDKIREKGQIWLEKEYSHGSNFIRNMKKNINKSCAHANMIYAANGFNFNVEEGKFDTKFFDSDDEYHVSTNLWTIGNIALGLVDLFYGVNKSINALTFTENFIPRLKELEQENNILKELSKQNPRYIRATQRK